MESGSAITRSLRARISALRGPGTSVLSSIVRVVATSGAYRLAVAMVLSDRTIRRLLEEGRIGIEPYEEELLQPSSVDVRVDRLFRVFRNSRYPFIDVKQEMEELTELVEVEPDEAFILHPGEFVLGSTLERITLPDDLVARLEGKSSLGRLGLLIHSTAGFIDPGWDGHVTLELSNVANLPDHDLLRDEDRAALVRAAVRAGRAPLRHGRARLEVPGPGGPDAEPLLEELPVDDPGRRRHRLRGDEGRPRAAGGRAARARARPPAGEAGPAPLVGLRGRAGRHDRRREPEAGGRGLHDRRPSRRPPAVRGRRRRSSA